MTSIHSIFSSGSGLLNYTLSLWWKRCISQDIQENESHYFSSSKFTSQRIAFLKWNISCHIGSKKCHSHQRYRASKCEWGLQNRDTTAPTIQQILPSTPKVITEELGECGDASNQPPYLPLLMVNKELEISNQGKQDLGASLVAGWYRTRIWPQTAEVLIK